ncbi:MAG: hypothetical protein WD824_15790 [Cyclobacteriaceae bacterium]
MNAEEFVRAASKMAERGETNRLKNGDVAISVSVFYPEKLAIKSRVERKRVLKKSFREKLVDLQSEGLEVDFDTISTSGQTVEAKVRLESVRSLFDKLQQKSLEIYPNSKHQVI